MLGMGNVKMFSPFAMVESKKLWVLLVSIRTITLFFLICPFNFNVWGCDILVIVDNDTCIMLSSSSSRENSGESSSSMFHSSLSESISCFTFIQFIGLFSFSTPMFRVPSFTTTFALTLFHSLHFHVSFSPSRRCGRTYFVLSVFTAWENLRLKYTLSTFNHYNFSCFFSVALPSVWLPL